MTPYYSDDWVRIYHGDCRDILPTLPKVDLVLTDPPYGLAYNAGSDMASQREAIFQGKANGAPRPIANDEDEQAAQELLREVLEAAKPLMHRGACCCCCGGGGGPKPLFARWTLMLDEIFDFKQAVVWDKGGLGMGIQFRRSYEFMLIAQKGSPTHRWNGGKTTSNVWRIPKIIPTINQHPTEKPLDLMGKCIELLSDTGDTVLEPFMGTAATLRAAKDLNRKAIGIEIEEKYCEIAAQRMSQEVLDFSEPRQ